MKTDSVSPPQVLAVSHGGFELIDMQANGSQVKMITPKNMKKNEPTNQPTNQTGPLNLYSNLLMSMECEHN